MWQHGGVGSDAKLGGRERAREGAQAFFFLNKDQHPSNYLKRPYSSYDNTIGEPKKEHTIPEAVFPWIDYQAFIN